MKIIKEPNDTRKGNFCIASNCNLVLCIIIIIIIIVFKSITHDVMTNSDRVKFHDTRITLKDSIVAIFVITDLQTIFCISVEVYNLSSHQISYPICIGLLVITAKAKAQYFFFARL